MLFLLSPAKSLDYETRASMKSATTPQFIAHSTELIEVLKTRSTAQIAGHPIHPMLIPVPVAFFVSTFVCDVIIWRNGNAGWITASIWLLGAGLVMAALAAVAGLKRVARGLRGDRHSCEKAESHD